MENNLHKCCIHCGSHDLFKMHDFSHAFLVKCKKCLLVFGQRIPSDNELQKHYGNYPRYTELSHITVKRYNELLDTFEKFRQTNNIIDLGCSNGLFLEVAKNRGWNVYGTEYDSACIEAGQIKGIKIFKSDHIPQELFNLKFDVVTSFEVIEHIQTPNEELEFVKKLLRDGGAFYVTTPNFNSVSRFFLQHRWNVIEYPEHLTYYSAFTLNRILGKHHFKKEFLITTGIAISRLRKSLGMKETNNLKEKNTDELLREKIEASDGLNKIKRILNYFLSSFKIGDAMKALYIKIK